MSKPLTIMEELLSRLDEDLRELWEERAAIMEYDGSLSRDHAECLALLNIFMRHPMALLGLRVLKLELDGETHFIITNKVPDGLSDFTEITDLAIILNLEFGGMARLVKVRESCHLI